MKADIAKKWVAALRSGEYEQGIEALCQEGKFCCLGVLCELASNEGVVSRTVINGDDAVYGIDLQRDYLPHEVQKWSGVRCSSGEYTALVDGSRYEKSLVGHNDVDNLSFDEIADIIEENAEVL